MINPFKGLGDLNQLRQQAQQMQQALAEEEVVVEKHNIKLVMSGDQKIKEITVNGEPDIYLAEVLEEALKKTQQIAAQKLMQMRTSGN